MSGISVRKVTFPFSFGSSSSCSIEVTSPARSGSKPIPVIPDCHGSVYSRFGSKLGDASVSTRLLMFGMADLSSFST